ncbi:hypothetical protein ACGFZU_38810 [Streptomyces tendae]
MLDDAGQGYGASESGRIVDGETPDALESFSAGVEPSGRARTSPSVS